MTATPGSFARAALIAFVAVILQLSGLGPDHLFGGRPDLVVLVVAAVAIYAGSVPGAAMGFGCGFLLDLAVGSTMGVSSLVLTAVGYGAGRVRELRDPAHGLAPVAVGAAATAVAALGLAVLQFLLGVEAPLSLQVLRQILMTIVLNTLLALPVYALCRRALLPFLPDDPRRRRRRAYTTGGLSPLSRA